MIKSYVLLALGGLVLSGCETTQVSAPPVVSASQSSGFEITSLPNSSERLVACKTTYDLKSREFAQCWAGERPTTAEFCRAAAPALNDPWASDWQKMAVYEKMHNVGCLQ